jgi:hypothetical protein
MPSERQLSMSRCRKPSFRSVQYRTFVLDGALDPAIGPLSQIACSGRNEERVVDKEPQAPFDHMFAASRSV